MKRLKRFCAIFVSIAVMISIFPKNVSAKAFNLSEYDGMGVMWYEMNSEQTLIQQNAKVKYYPGSVTKVLTVLTAMQYLDTQKRFTVTKEELSMVQPNSSKAGLKEGEILSFEQLIYATMIPSGNDATKVIAVEAGKEILKNPKAKGRDAYNAFIKEMNIYAKKIGMKDSHFTNSDGYDDEDNYSTPNDLIILGVEARKNPLLCDVADSSYKYVETNKYRHHWYSTNVLFFRNFDSIPGSPRSGKNPYYDERVTGFKTGYTDIGGRCFLLTANIDGMDIVGVIMNVQSSNRYKIWEYLKDMLDWTGETYTFVEFVNDENRSKGFEISNRGIFERDNVMLYAKAEDTYCLEKEKAKELKSVFMPKSGVAEFKDTGEFKTLKLLTSLRKGDVVGEWVYLHDNTEVHRVEMIVLDDFRKVGVLDYIVYTVIVLVLLYVVLSCVKTMKENKIKKQRREHERERKSL